MKIKYFILKNPQSYALLENTRFPWLTLYTIYKTLIRKSKVLIFIINMRFDLLDFFNWFATIYTYPFDDGVEAVVFVSGVFDNPDASVGFLQGVGSLDLVPVALFLGFFDVPSVLILYTVFVLVFWFSLKIKTIENYKFSFYFSKITISKPALNSK